MKKIILISVVLGLLILTNGLQAQTFKPGLFGGLVTSQMGGDGYSGFNKLGVTFGGFVRYSLNERWSTQFEIAYVQKGSRNNFSISENDPSQASEFFLLRLNYIEIPLLIKFNHNNFVYEGGLYFGQLIGFYMEYRNDNFSQFIYEDLDEFNDLIAERGSDKFVKDYDFGGMIGVGYKLTDNWLGSIRVSNSFMAIKEFESGAVDYYPTSFRIGWTNTVLLGTFRYTFGEGDEKHVVRKKE